MKFFYDLLHAGRTREDNPDFQVVQPCFSIFNVHPSTSQARATLIRALHTEYGSKLVDSLVRAAVLTLPSYTYHDIGDVLHECLQHDRASVCSWLEECLKTLQSSESNSINSITHKQVKDKTHSSSS